MLILKMVSTGTSSHQSKLQGSLTVVMSKQHTPITMSIQTLDASSAHGFAGSPQESQVRLLAVGVQA